MTFRLYSAAAVLHQSQTLLPQQPLTELQVCVDAAIVTPASSSLSASKLLASLQTLTEL